MVMAVICAATVAAHLAAMSWYGPRILASYAPTREEFQAAFRGLETTVVERLETMDVNQRAMDDRLDLLKEQLEPKADGWRLSITKKLDECCPALGGKR